MKIWELCVGAAVVVLWCGVAEAREWKKRDGTKLDAEFVEIKGKIARLKLKNGNITPVAIDRLSDEDQEFIKQQKSSSSKSGSEKSTDEKPTSTSPPSARSTEPLDSRLQLVGLHVTKDTPKPSEVGSNPRLGGMMPFSRSSTEFTLLVTESSGEVVGIDDAASKLASCTDDKGTNLLLGNFPPMFMSNEPFGSEKPDKGVREVRITLRTIPAQGATRLQVKGNIGVMIGTGEKKLEQKNVELKTGSTIAVEGVSLKIDSVQDEKADNVRATVQLSSNQPFDRIKSIKFLTADGKPIGQQNMGTSTAGGPGRMIYNQSWGLQEKVPTATVQLTLYEQFKTTVIPVALDFGIGL